MLKKKKRKIGIIGGAGPTAGAYLFQKVIEILQNKYLCKHDAEFPYVVVLSYPFSDMLEENFDRKTILKEIEECFLDLKKNDVEIAAIACNTLHSFLPSQIDGLKLVHIVEETKKFLENNNWIRPLILCSSTAATNKLHADYFECTYANTSTQKKIDDLIDAVTAGCCLKEASTQLSSLIEKDKAIVLGCTELSVIHETHPLLSSKVCNPNEILAEKICKLAFI